MKAHGGPLPGSGGRLRQRRSRVVPVITRIHRRRWSGAPATDRWALLHRLYAENRDAYLPKYFDKSRYAYPERRLARASRWYLGDVFFQALELVRRNGRHVHQATGIPSWRQRVDVLRMSVRLPSMPENYYKFELYRPENRARADQYLHRHETKGVLFKMLTDTPHLDRVSPLTNKAEFVGRADSAGLSVTPVLAVLEDGEVVAAPEELPAFDLFVKPKTGRGGSGAQVWAYDAVADSFRQVGGSTTVARADLLNVLAKLSRKRALIVQPRLSNHPEIVDVALDAVPTVRIITFTNESGDSEPVVAVFRMPAVPDKVVDNIHAGGIAAPVELTSGVLGKATDLGLAPSGRHSRHPQTGGQIEGRILPCWDGVLALAADAHRCFAPRVIAGWDISIGPDGPILVEGNSQPCVDLLQRPHDTPLGSHRFGELLAHHLEGRFGNVATMRPSAMG